MHESQQNQANSKSQVNSQTRDEQQTEESFLHHEDAPVQQFSGVGSIPNASIQAQMLSRIPVSQIAANPQLMLQMQQQFGNSHVSQVVQMARENSEQTSQQPVIQAKLKIGAPGDKYEQEADRVAAKVVQQINRPAPVSKTQGEVVQGKEEGLRMKPMPAITEQEAMPEEGELQMMPMVQRREAIGGGEASRSLSGEINQARGGGQPLDAGLQQSIGQAMGADFSGVRVHTDERADRLNRALSARAFTTGQDLFFKKGEYQPGSREGLGLIAHELTHVVQNGAGKAEKGAEKGRDVMWNSGEPKRLERIKARGERDWYGLARTNLTSRQEVRERMGDASAEQVRRTIIYKGTEYTRANKRSFIELFNKDQLNAIKKSIKGYYEVPYAPQTIDAALQTNVEIELESIEWDEEFQEYFCEVTGGGLERRRSSGDQATVREAGNYPVVIRQPPLHANPEVMEIRGLISCVGIIVELESRAGRFATGMHFVTPTDYNYYEHELTGKGAVLWERFLTRLSRQPVGRTTVHLFVQDDNPRTSTGRDASNAMALLAELCQAAGLYEIEIHTGKSQIAYKIDQNGEKRLY